jgi:hypothetical protein
LGPTPRASLRAGRDEANPTLRFEVRAWAGHTAQVQEEVLSLLRRQDAKHEDQGLQVSDIASELNVDGDSVLAVLNELATNGLAHKESFWWYSGPRLGHPADIDQV